MADKFYKDDVGTLIKVDVGVDVTGASGTTLEVKKPGGDEVSWPATVNTRYLEHTTILGDFDEVGVYFLQAALTFGGWTGRGETVSFRIYDEFKPES